MSVTCLIHSRCAFNFSSAVKVTCITELTALNNRAWFCCSITNLWSLKFMMQGLKKSSCGVSSLWKSEMPLRTLSCLSPKGPLFHSHPQVEGETSPLFSFWQGQLKCSRAFMTPGAAAVKRNAQLSAHIETMRSLWEVPFFLVQLQLIGTLLLFSKASKTAFSCPLSSVAGEFQWAEFQFN